MTIDKLLFKLRTTHQVKHNNKWVQYFVCSHEEAKAAILKWHKHQILQAIKDAKPEIRANVLGPVTLADLQRGIDSYEANLIKLLTNTNGEE